VRDAWRDFKRSYQSCPAVFPEELDETGANGANNARMKLSLNDGFGEVMAEVGVALSDALAVEA